MRKYFIIAKRNITKVIRFLTYDIWRVSKDDESKNRISLYNIIKAFMLVFRNIDGSQITTRASALTYSTLLSIIPMLAVLFAIARGFGFQNIVESQLFSFFSGQEAAINKAMQYIDSSIQYAQGGVFLGVGVVLLLYTVIGLLSNIESSFNKSWGVKKGRTYYRMFTDYLALIIIIPVFLVLNYGIMIFLNSVDSGIGGIVMNPLMEVVPFLITIFLFIFLFLYIPNTRVKVSAALFGGIFTGVCFQVFQFLYISGQIWISKYNAIYGSFAALPLLLLWLNLTWMMILLGVELSFAFQNVNKFSFEYETENISRRYKDFVIILIMTLIVKRFEEGGKAYTSDELSESHQIPTKLTQDILFFLQEAGLIVEVTTEDDWVSGYIPAIDINKITVSYLFSCINKHGSEDFIIDISEQFKGEWNAMLKLTDYSTSSTGQILLKDL